MNALLTRILLNWKTTVGGLLAIAAVIVGAFATNGYTGKELEVAGAIITGLTGLLAKDS